MKEKLEFLLQNKGLTATSLARLLDIQPSGISHILSGRNKPSFDLVAKILRLFPDLNPDWFMLDKGDPFRSAEASIPTDDELAPIVPITPVASLFDDVPNNEFSERNVEQKNDDHPIFSVTPNSSKTVERIIVLYSDKSFDSYTPRR